MRIYHFVKLIEEVCNHLAESLFPSMALAGGFPSHYEAQEKPMIECHKGGGTGPRPPQPPAPPEINFPDPPKPPPPPPPPPSQTDVDVTAQSQETMRNKQKGFGYRATLLNGGSSASTNSATGSGSLLGS